jgi:hypothetical protein
MVRWKRGQAAGSNVFLEITAKLGMEPVAFSDSRFQFE